MLAKIFHFNGVICLEQTFFAFTINIVAYKALIATNYSVKSFFFHKIFCILISFYAFLYQFLKFNLILPKELVFIL